MEKFYDKYGEYLGKGILLYDDNFFSLYNYEVEIIIEKLTENYLKYDDELIEKVIELLSI